MSRDSSENPSSRQIYPEPQFSRLAYPPTAKSPGPSPGPPMFGSVPEAGTSVASAQIKETGEVPDLL
jgi:hypothetical protein